MTLKVDELVKAGIQTEILKALNDAPEYINMLVDSALNQEVDDYGGKPSYSSSKKPYLEYVVGEQLRIFTGTAVRQWLEDNEPTIRAAIVERLVKVDIAEAFADAVAKQINDNWGINVYFNREPQR